MYQHASPKGGSAYKSKGSNMGITPKELAKYTDARLEKLVKEAQATLAARKKVNEFKSRLAKDVEKAGLSMSDIMKNVARRGRPAGSGKHRQHSKGASKYVHKTDHNKTWSGRGRPPLWLKKHGMLANPRIGTSGKVNASMHAA